MSIETRSALMVGLPRANVKQSLDNLDDLIDRGALECCPAFYDGMGDEEALVGFSYRRSPLSAAVEIEWNPTEIEALRSRFKTITGLEAKLWLSPWVN